MEYIKDAKSLVEQTNKTIKVGVVSFSDEKYIESEDQVKAYFRQGIMDLGLQHNNNIEIVSGLTNMGVPKLAYEEAKRIGYKTTGITALEAKEYPCYPVDETIYVGTKFGDESPFFLQYCDYLIKIGGGPQSIKEYKSFDKKKVDYDLNKGTYAGIRLSEDDTNYIRELCLGLEIPNIISRKKMHITLLYSRKECPNYVPSGMIDEVASPTGFKVFDTFDDKRALVLLLDSPYLVDRHNHLMDKHNGVYDWSETGYKPHITLSYDLGDFPLPKFENIREEFKLVEEYHEDLKLEWKPK